jgi:cyclase
MVKTRLIPVLLLRDGQLVRAQEFHDYRVIGNPLFEVERYNQWNVDELIYLDISRGRHYGSSRSDQKGNMIADTMDLLGQVSKRCFMPLTWGGNVSSVEQMRKCFALGADKISINTAAYERPELISEAATSFGNQAVVVSIDVLAKGGTDEVCIDGGRKQTGRDAVSWAVEAETRGAGEILLTSIERDGTGKGYNTGLIQRVADAVRIPVIACGGAGDYFHYVDAVTAGASAVAAANIFHFRELSDMHGTKAMSRAGLNVRI